MRRLHAVLAAALALCACGRKTDVPPPVPHPAVRLAFAAELGGAVAGQMFAPAIEVRVEDAAGDLVEGAVTVAITAEHGALGGTATAVAVGGIATFADLYVTLAGTTTLSASADGLAGDTTAQFMVLPGAPASLAFTAEPLASITAGDVLGEPRVGALDGYGNVVADAVFDVSLALEGAELLGAATRPLADGVASFTGLSVEKAGTGYVLRATGGGLGPLSSAPFDGLAGAADHIVLDASALGTTLAAGASIPAVTVSVVDRCGNLVASASGDATMSLTGPAATLYGTLSLALAGGSAVFDDLSVRKAGAGYHLAIAGPVTGATSAAFDVVPKQATALAFDVQPLASVTAGDPLGAPRVAALDEYGNVTAAAFDVTLALDGATLVGTVTRALADGAAAFPGLTVERAGAGYVLTASGGGLGPLASAAFDVNAGAAHHLVFSAGPPPAAAAGAALGGVTVSAVDAFGNVAASASSTVTVSLGAGPAATLSGTLTRALLAGTVVFGDLSLVKAGTGYRLAAAGAVTGATSAAFDVFAGPPNALRFTVEPSPVRAGQPIAPAVEVAITDAWGNPAGTTEATVALALEPNGDGAVLAGATSRDTSGHVAVFDALSVATAGTGLRIRATSPGLAEALSATFDVSPSWLSVGPDGGEIQALAADPTNGQVAYAATNGSVWKTTDGAANWTRASRGLPLYPIDALAVDPSNAARVYAAAYDGLYLSADGAASWRKVATLGIGSYRTLSVAVTAAGIAYVGTYQNGLWRSADAGETWQQLSTGLPSKKIPAIALDPTRYDVLYAAGVDPNDVGTVYRSTSGGGSWAATPLGPAAFAGVKPGALLVDPAFADTIYAGTATGIYESTNQGASWVYTVPGPDVREFAAYDGGSRVRYAGAVTEVIRKVDGGPWTSLASSVMPGFPTTTRGFSLAMRGDGAVIAGAYDGVYVRPASSWQQSTTGIRAHNTQVVRSGRAPAGNVVVYAATPGMGVFRSLDGGATWQRGTHPAWNQWFYGLALERADARRAWLAGAIGLYRTTDGGATWTAVTIRDATGTAYGGSVWSVLVDPQNDSIVYAGGNSDIYRTTAGFAGNSKDLNACNGPMRVLALSPNAPLALWVGQDAGVCRVDLGGLAQTFVPYVSQPGTSGSITAVAIDPDPALAGSTVWATSSQGLHTTTDGATWTKRLVQYADLLAQPGKLYAASLFGPVELSRDSGATFVPVGTGLYGRSTRCLSDVPGTPDEIYVGTSWGSVFKTTSGGE